MFILGCAGDSNPYPRGTMEMSKDHGAALGKEVGRVLETKLQPVHGPLAVAFGKADLPLQQPPSRADLEKQAAGKNSVQAWIAKQMLEKLERGEKLPTHYPAPIAVWQLGKDLTLVGLSGDAVVDYVAMLEKARVLKEGGYETRGLYSGGIGLFDAKTQDVLVAKARELAEKAGRPVPKAKAEAPR